MEFDLERSYEILSSTPTVMRSLLLPLSADWVEKGGSEKNWAPYDVVAHLIYAEQEDWLPRARLILSDDDERTFAPFDQAGHLRRKDRPSLAILIEEFSLIRASNLDQLRLWDIDDKMLQRTGIHPAFGEVTLKQLLSTWTVHDLNHLRQIAVFMAMKYAEAVGPWSSFLKILQ